MFCGNNNPYSGSSLVCSTFVNVTCKSKVRHHRNEVFPQQYISAGQVAMHTLQTQSK